MKVILFVCMVISFSFADVSVYVSDNDPKGLNVRATPGGQKTGVLPSGEYFVELVVDRIEGSWLKYSKALVWDEAAESGYKEKETWPKTGWVHTSLVNVTLRTHADYGFCDFPIYEQPQKDSPVKVMINRYEKITVKMVMNDWVRLAFEFENGVRFEGWVHSSEICINPYRLCC